MHVSEAIDTLGKDKKGGVGEFIRETREEVDKTTFPSSDEVWKTTMVVLFAVIFFAAYLFVVDLMWVNILDGITWLINKIVGV
jgi:preprotein translocase SecE subunit